jgi:ribosomal protein L17
LKKPDISILSEEFLAEVRGMPQRNLAVELLQKLLRGEIQTRRRKNIVQARSFAEMLEQAIRRYQNRAIEAAQVIEELIQLAREMREADRRGEQLGLTDEEVAFYDALETNDSAVKVLGDETLRAIARELVAVGAGKDYMAAASIGRQAGRPSPPTVRRRKTPSLVATGTHCGGTLIASMVAPSRVTLRTTGSFACAQSDDHDKLAGSVASG